MSSISHSVQQPEELAGCFVEHILAARNVIPHFENAVAIAFSDIGHDVLVKNRVGVLGTLLNHLHLSGVGFTGLGTASGGIRCLVRLVEEFQVGGPPAQSIKSIVGFLPDWILPAEVLEFVVSLPFYVIRILLGHFRSYCRRHYCLSPFQKYPVSS